jgi:nucleoside-triphosphatase THEP1
VDKVQIDLHLLRALMLHEIGGEVDHVDFVIVDEAGVLEGVVELVDKLA